MKYLLTICFVLFAASVAFPVVYDTATIREYGGDYSSTSAWEAGEDRDLTTLGEVHVGLIGARWTSSESSAIGVDGWTTADTAYIKLAVDPNSPAYHRGVFDTTAPNYRLVTALSGHLNKESYIRFEGIQIVTSSTSGATYNYNLLGTSSSPYDIRITDGIIVRDVDASGVEAIRGDNASGRITFANNLFIGPEGDNSCAIQTWHASCSTFTYNNTFYRQNKGFFSNTGGTIGRIFNNIFVDCDTAVHHNSGTEPTVDYNTTDNSVIGYGFTAGTENQTSKSFIFEDSANGRFWIDIEDTGARGFGLDMSSDTYYPFSVDVLAATRSAWDCGWHEYNNGIDFLEIHAAHDDSTGWEDSYLYSWVPTGNYGSAAQFDIGLSSGDSFYGIFKTSGVVGSIPAGKKCDSAWLALVMTSIGGADSLFPDVRRVLANWVEAQVTWNIYSTGNSWTTAGALSEGNDILATTEEADNVCRCNDVASWGQFTSSAMCAAGDTLLIRVHPNTVDSISSSDLSNYGWIVQWNGDSTGASCNHVCYSRDYSSDATQQRERRPYMVIHMSDTSTAVEAGQVIIMGKVEDEVENDLGAGAMGSFAYRREE